MVDFMRQQRQRNGAFIVLKKNYQFKILYSKNAFKNNSVTKTVSEV